MGELLNNIESLAKTFANATDLYDFYQQSELVRLSVALAEQFQIYSETSDEYIKKHIRLDIDDIIIKYKNSLQEIGIDANNYFR